MRGTDRIMALVELLVSSEEDMGIREIAERTEIPKSTVQRMLASLQKRHWVVQDSKTHNYRMGFRLLMLADMWRLRQELNRQSKTVLENLSLRTNQTSLLLVPSGTSGVCLNKVEPERSLKLVAEVGKTFPLHAAACGKILLAFSSSALQNKIFSSTLRSFTSSTIIDTAVLRKEIETIRLQGYAVSFGEMTAGAAEVGVPILDGDGNILAALSLAGPSSEIKENWVEYKNILQQAVLEILGHSSCQEGAVP